MIARPVTHLRHATGPARGPRSRQRWLRKIVKE